MAKNTAQIIFECPEAFRKRLFEEKLKRRMSIKRLIMEAVQEHWFARRKEEPIAIILGDPVDPEHTHWAEMFKQYMERCPSEKVKLLQDVIKQDLQIYKSKRKTGRARQGKQR